MEGLQQLEHEIQRHLALAQLTDGAIRDGHLEAARQLAALREFFQEDDMSKREKGATGLDRLCHKFYELPKGVGLQVDRKCRRCGGSLMAYPCKGCVWTARCDHTGQVCDAWRRWFTANYDNAARQLRAAARKEAQCRNND